MARIGHTLTGRTVTLDVAPTFYEELCYCERDTVDASSEEGHLALADAIGDAVKLPTGRYRLTLDFDGLEWLATQIDYQLDRIKDAFGQEPLMRGALERSGRSLERQAKALLDKYWPLPADYEGA